MSIEVSRLDFWCFLLEKLEQLELTAEEFSMMISDFEIKKWSLENVNGNLVGYILGKQVRIVDREEC